MNSGKYKKCVGILHKETDQHCAVGLLDLMYKKKYGSYCLTTLELAKYAGIENWRKLGCYSAEELQDDYPSIAYLNDNEEESLDFSQMEKTQEAIRKL